MLGTLKSKQIDVLSSAISITTEAEKNGWGKVIYSPSDEKTWNAVIGGPVPVNANFCLAPTIEKEPEKVQAFTNAVWRAVQWIKANSPETILDTIERFVGSTSKQRQPARDRRPQGSRRLERPDPRGQLGARREGLVRRADRAEADQDGRRRRRQVPQGGACQVPRLRRCRIEIDKLRKGFLANGREVVAVDDASFRINDGEFVALLGPSGCGKSTILNMVATLIPPTGGDIRSTARR